MSKADELNIEAVEHSQDAVKLILEGAENAAIVAALIAIETRLAWLGLIIQQRP